PPFGKSKTLSRTGAWLPSAGIPPHSAGHNSPAQGDAPGQGWRWTVVGPIEPRNGGSLFHAHTGGSVSPDTPVLDTIIDITAVSIDHSSGSPREFMLARLAALIAVDAPPASYLANAPALEEAGLTADDIQRVMIAVAPVVGTPRVVSASGQILRALGFAI